MKEEKKQSSLFDSGITGTRTKANKKIDSYFDGQQYRGYMVKTFMVRENVEKYNPAILNRTYDIYQMFKTLENLDHECFYSVVVDGANKVTAVQLAFQGTLNQCLVHPREIFKTAVLCCGAGIILIHNHPSGKAEPSKEDFVMTKRLVDAGNIMGIEILDHIIIGYKKYFSFRKKRLLKNF